MYLGCTVKTIIFLIFVFFINENVQAQKKGETKKISLEYIKLDPKNGIAYFIDRTTKITYEYDIFYMRKEKPKEFAKVSKAIITAYNYCMGAANSCGFYGQKYKAEIVYGAPYTAANDKNSKATNKHFKWQISSLTRDILASPPTLAYIPEVNDQLGMTYQMYLIIGENEYEIEKVEGDFEFKRYGGNFISEIQALNPGKTDSYVFKLTEKVGDNYIPYYQLLIRETRNKELVFIETTKFDLKGNQIEDTFHTGYSKEATVKYLNEKLAEVNGLKVGSEWNVFSEKNGLAIKANEIIYSRDWGVNPGYKKCKLNKYETLYHDIYHFNPAEIDKIVEGGDEEEKPTGYFRILFKKETVRKFENYHSCEEDGSNYDWVKSETESKYIKSMIVYFLKADSDNFERIKKALLHLRDLYKKGK